MLNSDNKFWKEQGDSEGKSHACEFEKLSLELSTKHAEVLKLCDGSNDRCTQLEESMQRLEAADACHKGTDPSDMSVHEKFESLLAQERKAWQELVQSEAEARANDVHKLRESFNTFINEVQSHATVERCVQTNEINHLIGEQDNASTSHYNSYTGLRAQRKWQRKG